MTFRSQIVAGLTLIREAIQSQNYVPGISGWIIESTGNAEFNNLTVRGVFMGNQYIINDNGVFLYSGLPAAGNMSGSWAPVAGTDDYGNAYPAGLKIYSVLGTVFLGALDGVFRSIGHTGNLVEIQDGSISLSKSGDWATAQITNRTGALISRSGAVNVGDLVAQFQIIGSDGITPGDPETYPRTITADYATTDPAMHFVSGAVMKCSIDGETAESWNSPSAYGANWSAGAGSFNGVNGFSAVQYTKGIRDDVEIVGVANCSGTATTIFTLAAGYRPPTGLRAMLPANFVIGGTATPGFVQVIENGAVTCPRSVSGVTVAAGSQVYIHGSFSLRNYI